jgi:hypothetical protein
MAWLLYYTAIVTHVYIVHQKPIILTFEWWKLGDLLIKPKACSRLAAPLNRIGMQDTGSRRSAGKLNCKPWNCPTMKCLTRLDIDCTPREIVCEGMRSD